MNKNEVCEMLFKLNIPFVYSHFKEGSAPNLPFLIYYYSGENTFKADGKLYYKVKKLILELYTDQKDFSLEEKLEQLLTENNLIYTKDEVWIASEEMYETIYKMEV